MKRKTESDLEGVLVATEAERLAVQVPETNPTMEKSVWTEKMLKAGKLRAHISAALRPIKLITLPISC